VHASIRVSEHVLTSYFRNRTHVYVPLASHIQPMVSLQDKPTSTRQQPCYWPWTTIAWPLVIE